MTAPLRRNRDFRLLWSGSAISVLGSWSASVAYPLLVLAITGSPGAAGLVAFVGTLPLLFLQLPAGALVDRWDRKRVMIVSDAVRALGAASVVLALFLGTPALGHIMVVAFAEATCSIFFDLSAMGAVRNVVRSEDLPVALSRYEVRDRGALLLGRPLGGALFGIARWLPFLFDAVSYVVSLVTLLLIKKNFQERSEEMPERGRLLTEIREGITWLWRQPFLRATAALVAGSNLMFQALVLVLIVTARENGASAATTGVMLGIAGVGGVLGAVVAPWCERRFSLRGVVVGTNWVWASLMPLIVVFDQPYLLGAVYGLMVVVGPAWNVAIVTYQLRITPDHLQGRVGSAAALLGFGAIPLGSGAAGLLLQLFGSSTAVLVLTGWMVLLALIATLTPAVRRAGEPQPEPLPAT